MIKKIFAALLLTLIFTLAVGCSTPETPDVDTGEPEGGTPEPPKEGFNIYKDGEFVSAIILPDGADSLETTIANRISTAILAKTKKSIPILKESEAPSTEGAILVGRTSAPESVAVYDALEKRSARVEITGGRLVVAFNYESCARTVASELANAISGSYANVVYIPLDFSATDDSLPADVDIPALLGAEVYSDGNDTTMSYCKADGDKFAEYCSMLDGIGFEKLSERSECGNLFATYKGEDSYLYVYYTNSTGEVRVIRGPISQLALEDYSTDTPNPCPPYITSIPQKNNGLGLIMRLPDGRFIIHDGGYSGDDKVYARLRELIPSGDIVIAAWIISHPHGDHYGAFTEFIKNHKNDESVTIERVMMNVTEERRYNIDNDEMTEDVTGDHSYIFNTIRTCIPSVPVLKVHTGQIIDFGSATLEILYTVEDIMPKELPNINDSSLVVRLVMGDASFMLLADTCYASGPIMNAMWGEHLKSDIVQVAHHGQWPSVESIYHSIAAEVVLVPAVLSRYKYDISDTRWDEQTEAFLSYAKDLYTTCNEPIMIELPYAPKNNKAEMVEFIKNYEPEDGEPTS